MVGFSARLQLSVLSELVNWQSDKLVVGLVAPAATVGQLGIGAQFADGGRLLSGAALSPIQSSFALAAGAGDDEGLRHRFHELHRLWVLGVLGAGAIGAASLPPLIEAWLGRGYGEAALLGAFLVLGSAAGLSTGTGVAYMRAIGKPGLEARMGPLIVGGQPRPHDPARVRRRRPRRRDRHARRLRHRRELVLQPPAAPRPGLAGPQRRRRRRRARRRAAGRRAPRSGSALAAVALLPGRAALPVVALGVACALLAYAAVLLRVVPTPARLRRAIAVA